MRLSAFAFALVGSAVPSVAADTAIPSATTLRTAEPPARTLLGDWEPPDVVGLVYSDSWASAFAEIVEALAREVPVMLLTEDGLTVEETSESVALLPENSFRNVWVADEVVDSAWIRDYGPLQARTTAGSMLWIDAPYADDRPLDDEVPALFAATLDVAVEHTWASLDGGAIASNGAQLCVSTIEYFEKMDIALQGRTSAEDLMQQLGCATLVLVPSLSAEGTKHVDLFLQFVEPTVALLARFDPEEAPSDARRMDRVATTLADAAGDVDLDLTIERIDLPPPKGEFYQSWLNYFRLPSVVLVPSFEDVDRGLQAAAHERLAELMPTATLVPIPSDELVSYGGAVHCLVHGISLR
jgi:agmatine/peptidylarginine deiminase